MRRLIYVSGPYSKPEGHEEENVRRALQAADELLFHGFTPFVPHLTHYWNLRSPKSWVDWVDYDLQFLRVCDAVLRLPGESLGGDIEVAVARLLSKPVLFSLGDLIATKGG